MQYNSPLGLITNAVCFVFIQFRSLGATDDSDSLLCHDQRRQAVRSFHCLLDTYQFLCQNPNWGISILQRGPRTHALAGKNSRIRLFQGNPDLENLAGRKKTSQTDCVRTTLLTIQSIIAIFARKKNPLGNIILNPLHLRTWKANLADSIFLRSLRTSKSAQNRGFSSVSLFPPNSQGLVFPETVLDPILLERFWAFFCASPVRRKSELANWPPTSCFGRYQKLFWI